MFKAYSLLDCQDKPGVRYRRTHSCPICGRCDGMPISPTCWSSLALPKRFLTCSSNSLQVMVEQADCSACTTCQWDSLDACLGILWKTWVESKEGSWIAGCKATTLLRDKPQAVPATWLHTHPPQANAMPKCSRKQTHPGSTWHRRCHLCWGRAALFTAQTSEPQHASRHAELQSEHLNRNGWANTPPTGILCIYLWIRHSLSGTWL